MVYGTLVYDITMNQEWRHILRDTTMMNRFTAQSIQDPDHIQETESRAQGQKAMGKGAKPKSRALVSCSFARFSRRLMCPFQSAKVDSFFLLVLSNASR
jgi:hypothetical protein